MWLRKSKSATQSQYWNIEKISLHSIPPSVYINNNLKGNSVKGKSYKKNHGILCDLFPWRENKSFKTLIIKNTICNVSERSCDAAVEVKSERKVNHLRSNNIRQFGSIVAQFESSNQITQNDSISILRRDIKEETTYF